MREYLFRGQTRRPGQKVRIGDGKPLPGEWAYGGITFGSGVFSIIYGGTQKSHRTTERCVVYSDTVGQYTGFEDKNGNKIFEDDIVTFRTIQYIFFPCRIIWNDKTAQFVAKAESGRTYPMNADWIYEIIGNIHDSPELWKEAACAAEA